jgi:NADH:ubiquinone oxidoreductase subunit 4 (subunit M)
MARVMWLGMTGAAAMVVTGACLIWTYQRVFLGAAKPEHSNVARMSSSEKWILAVFALAAVVLGVVPGAVLEPMRATLEAWMRGMQW